MADVHAESRVRVAVRLPQLGAGTALPAPQGDLGLPAPDSGSGLRRGERGHPVVLGCPVCGGRLRRPWDLATTSESAGCMPGRGIAESEATTGSVTAPETSVSWPSGGAHAPGHVARGS